MTPIDKVADILMFLQNENPLAQIWLRDESIQKKIAEHYDDWIQDSHDHKMPMSLFEHIEYCLDCPEILDIKVFKDIKPPK